MVKARGAQPTNSSFCLINFDFAQPNFKIIKRSSVKLAWPTKLTKTYLNTFQNQQELLCILLNSSETYVMWTGILASWPHDMDFVMTCFMSITNHTSVKIVIRNYTKQLVMGMIMPSGWMHTKAKQLMTWALNAAHVYHQSPIYQFAQNFIIGLSTHAQSGTFGW